MKDKNKVAMVAAIAFSMVAGLALAEEVTCESIDGRQTECPINTRGDVHMVRQLSSTTCREDQNWGLFRNAVWVNEGCRAVFASSDGGYGGNRPGDGYVNNNGNRPGYGEGPDRATCESIDEKRAECAMSNEGRIRLTRQLSKTQCIEGRNWGTYRRGVWVSDGCRAEFEIQGGGHGGGHAGGNNGGNQGGNNGWNPPPNGSSRPQEVSCASISRREECAMDTSGGIRIISERSTANCVEGQTWGTGRNKVWVSAGCRGTFVRGGYGAGGGNRPTPPPPNRPGSGGGINGPDQVTCESVDDKQQECVLNTSGEVRLILQLSSTKCVQGRNWGLYKRSVWVKDGCRGVFGSDGSGSSNEPSTAPAAAIRGCRAERNQYGQVTGSSPLRRGYWEVLITYGDGDYVCNVSDRGSVSRFERTRSR